MLSLRQRRTIRRASQRAETLPDSTDDELCIVPLLDVLVNLVCFMLIVIGTPLFLSQVDAQLPKYGPGAPSWSPTVMLTREGVHVRDASGAYAAGCTTRGAGLTLPKVAGDYDWSALRYCAERLRAAHPDARHVDIGADADVPFQSLLSAMDALRGDRGQHFSEVRLVATLR